MDGRNQGKVVIPSQATCYGSVVHVLFIESTVAQHGADVGS
jgi:hypothetical protein